MSTQADNITRTNALVPIVGLIKRRPVSPVERWDWLLNAERGGYWISFVDRSADERLKMDRASATTPRALVGSGGLVGTLSFGEINRNIGVTLTIPQVLTEKTTVCTWSLTLQPTLEELLSGFGNNVRRNIDSVLDTIKVLSMRKSVNEPWINAQFCGILPTVFYTWVICNTRSFNKFKTEYCINITCFLYELSWILCNSTDFLNIWYY